MLISYKNGQGSIILRFKLLDSTVSTGAGKTGLTNSSTGLIISTIASNEASATTYTSGGSTIETITTLGTYAAPTATKCRFKEVDSTNHKGIYELQLADARFAVSNAKFLLVSVSGVTGLAECDFLVPLTSFDPYDSVRAGLTALPNAAAEASGGLYTRGTGAGQINQDANGRIDANVKTWIGGTIPAVNTTGVPLVDTKYITGTLQTARDIGASVLLSSGTGTGQVSLSSGTVTVGTNNDKTGYGLSSAAVQAIWDALTSALTTVGSVGKLLVDRIDAAISSRSSHVAADIWSVGTRILTAGTNIVLAKGTGVTGFNDLDAAGVRAAVGLSSANLDTQIGTLATSATLATVDSNVSAILIDTGTDIPATLATIAGYIDTEIGTLQTSVDDIPTNAELATALASADDATLAAIAALSIPTANQNADALLDRSAGVETGLTVREWARLTGSILLGKVSGAGTGTETFRDINDTKDRIVATVDVNGNRTAITRDAT